MLQLEACLISQGLTLIFTPSVYTKVGLSQKHPYNVLFFLKTSGLSAVLCTNP